MNRLYRITPNSRAGRGNMTLGGAAKWYLLKEVLHSKTRTGVWPRFYPTNVGWNLRLTHTIPTSGCISHKSKRLFVYYCNSLGVKT